MKRFVEGEIVYYRRPFIQRAFLHHDYDDASMIVLKTPGWSVYSNDYLCVWVTGPSAGWEVMTQVDTMYKGKKRSRY